MNYAFIALLTITIGIVGTIVTVFVYAITMPLEKKLTSSDLVDNDAQNDALNNVTLWLREYEDILNRNAERDAKRYRIDRMRAKIIPGIKTGKVIAGSKTFNWDTVEKKEVSKPFKFSRRAYSNTFNAGVYAMLLR